MTQISLFDGNEKFIIDKPIRLIELFAGYGSQSLALKYLGVNFEHYKIAEWTLKSTQAYKDLHFGNDKNDYSKEFSVDYLIDYLFEKGVSQNYSEPMTKEQIKRLGEQKIRNAYNNIIATNNLVSVCTAKGKDLEIVDTDQFTYLLTYSFPCQDLSSAGLGKGMGKGSGTRSGLLWEVERLLDETENLPQVLVMENVPEVIGANNIEHFAKWLEKLESLGYKNKWEILNAKDFGIPQNRERCFMVSILGDYYYEFPKTIPLKLRLKDMLEENVDESFYLTKPKIEQISKWKAQQDPLKDIDKEKVICQTLTAMGAGEEYSGMVLINESVYQKESLKTQLCDNLINSGILKENDVINHSYTNGGNGKNPKSRQTLQDYIETQDNTMPTLTTRPDCLGVVVNDYDLGKQVCDLAIKNNLLEPYDIFDYSFSNSRLKEIENGYIKKHENNNCSPTIMTTCEHLGLTTENLRIRKLTPKECFRLMGVKDEDFENVKENQSNASLYHLAGDSICTTVLMAIFKQML